MSSFAMDRPPTIVAVGIVIEAGRLLICRRPDGVPLGGLWELPGGKLNPGESPAAAVVRELAEELAISVEPTGELPPITHDYPHARVTLIPVLCRRTAGTPQPLGCTAWTWAAPADLPRYAFPTATTPLLARLTAGSLQNAFTTGNVPGFRAISSAG